MQIILPWPPKELNPNVKVHWGAKSRAAKRHKESCYYWAKSAKTPKFKTEAINLKITFHPPDKKRRDLDNLLAASKYLLDALALAWNVNDSRFVPVPCWGEVFEAGKVVVEA